MFVKPPHGSSASGVVALAFGGTRGDRDGGVRRVSAYTSAVLDGDRLYNELRVRHYTDERSVAAIIDRLAADSLPGAGGLHVERWLPKASHEGLVFDLRVLVVAGRVSHVVVRTGRSPMTNLHLGNARGDLPGVRAAAGEERWAAAMRTCEAAAACFPGSLHVGVDLMFGRDYGTHAVAEVNAFGDLLPGLLVDGRDTYAAEIDALLSGRFTAPAATRAGVAGRCPVKALIGSHDLLFVTLDTLRHDVAAGQLAAGRTPNLARVLPGGVWQRRHTPASFTYAAHHAFFGGFLPTPVTPGPHERPFAARFPGSTTVGRGHLGVRRRRRRHRAARGRISHDLHRRGRLLRDDLGAGRGAARPVRRGALDPASSA